MASLNFDNVSFHSTAGGVHFSSTADISFLGGAVLGSFINPEGVNVDINGTSLTLAAGPSLDDIEINGRNNVTVNGATINGLGSSQLRMNALNTLDVRNTGLSGFSFINLEARTVVLQNIDFPAGSTVQLKSQNGLLAPNPNTSQSIQNGFVNYISNVRYNGLLLSSTPNPNITISVRP